MTKKEIEKFLGNTKVYVDGKSAEIQRKLFSFGYHWGIGDPTKVRHQDSPFLYIHRNKEILHSYDMTYFSSPEFRKITANKILSLEITEPSYRAFKDQKECWNEMQKHQPIGWIKPKDAERFYCITVLSANLNVCGSIYKYTEGFNDFTFADGQPFGIKED